MVCGYQYRSEFVGFLKFKNVALLNRVVWHRGNCLAEVDVERICCPVKSDAKNIAASKEEKKRWCGVVVFVENDEKEEKKTTA